MYMYIILFSSYHDLSSLGKALASSVVGARAPVPPRRPATTSETKPPAGAWAKPLGQAAVFCANQILSCIHMYIYIYVPGCKLCLQRVLVVLRALY